MNTIKEIRRIDAPAPKPQALACGDNCLWMGSLATQKIYQLDPQSLQILWQTDAPGYPFSIAVVGEELRVICGETDEDNRNIRRCLPGKGFDTQFGIQCPDDTGSQLGYDGANLHVSQWYNQRVLKLGSEGEVEKSYPIPHGIAGQVIVDGCIYLVTTDDEETNDYYLTRIDPTGPEPKVEDLAKIPFPARSLSHDGQNFWTNHRAANQTICFTL